MGRHKADETPGWLRAAVDAAIKGPKPTPVGGFVMDGEPRTRASIRRREAAMARRQQALTVSGTQLLTAARYPVMPRQGLTAPEGIPVAAPPPAEDEDPRNVLPELRNEPIGNV